MRARLMTAAAVILAVEACGPGGARKDSATSASIVNGSAPVPAPAAATRPLFAGFVPLPARMSQDGAPAPEARIALGRRLFYEPMLSRRRDIACYSCHLLYAYGVDGLVVSHGERGRLDTRNAPSVYNAAGQVAEQWDGRAANVEEQAREMILDPERMGMPGADVVVARLRAAPDYQEAFRAAFPDDREPLTFDNVGRAIGAFERELVTPSRWDHYLRGDASALSDAERHGAETFVSIGCADCHNGAYVGGRSFQKLGRRMPWPTRADLGRFLVTGRREDALFFKVPSLRNVSMTAPYMHDGSVVVLEDAIRLMGRFQLGVELDSAQVADIRAWMSALTGVIPFERISGPASPTAPK